MKTNLGSLLAGLFTLVAMSSGLRAGPANDNFANRAVLTGTNVTVNGNNSGATVESGEPVDQYAGELLTQTVWYTWTAPSAGVVHFSTSTTVYAFVVGMVAYRGEAVNALTQAPQTPDGNVPVNAGDTLQIQISSVEESWNFVNGAAGPFTLTFWLQLPDPTSPNDDFANRLEITIPTYHFDGSIYGATAEPGEPLPSPDETETLWWSFEAPVDGWLEPWASSADFTPTVTVYEGSSLLSLSRQPLAGGTTCQVQAGHEYAVQVAAANAPLGQVSFDSRFYAASNDMFAGAEHLEGTNIMYVADCTLATFEPGEPASPATNTVWLAWAAPATGRVSYNCTTTPYGSYAQVFTGPSLELLEPPYGTPEENLWANFLAFEGTVYYIQLSGGSPIFTFTLDLSPYGECSNDNFADAQVVKGDVVYFEPMTVDGATMEPGEPQHMGAVPQKSIWWEWQAPVWGMAHLDSSWSMISNVFLAAYSGDTVQSLTRVGKGYRQIYFNVSAGETYHIAGVVPTNAVGDIYNYLQMQFQDSSVHIVPGNLLQQPSWEGTALCDTTYWHWTGGLGGSVNEPGGVDGMTWPELGVGTIVWQDIPTVPGHQHNIRFAYLSSDGAGVNVYWDSNYVGSAVIGTGESLWWHWGNFSYFASNTTSRVAFQAFGDNVQMDAFSVVDESAPPVITTQPASISTVGGGDAAFGVGVTGGAPLSYQWYFNQGPMDGETNNPLVMDSVSTNATGSYFVVVTNAFGSATSQPAALLVDAPTYPTLAWEPYGDTVGVGSYYQFGVGALGTPPFSYQWYFDGGAITNATGSTLTFTNVQSTNAGAYSVSVQNPAGTVWSLPASLFVVETNQSGGVIFLDNRFWSDYGTNVDAPVFDVDGVTRLSGSNYVAQLYAGPSLDWLRPAGQPTPFLSGFGAGYFFYQTVTLPNVPPGGPCVAQVRAWDATMGNSYEEARALGGRFGKSELLTVTAGGGDLPAGVLDGLSSFNLQAGLPEFTSGVIQAVGTSAGGVVTFSLTGEAGYNYLVEKASQDFVWRPYVVLTNVAGTVTFTDTAAPGSAVTFYRARILD